MDLIRWFSGSSTSPLTGLLPSATEEEVREVREVQEVREVHIVPKEGVIIPGLNDQLRHLEYEEKGEIIRDIIEPHNTINKKKIIIYEKPPKKSHVIIENNDNVIKQKSEIISKKWTNSNTNKVPKDSKERKSILIRIPYKKIDMIRILQDRYEYEIKGTFYFDDNLKFQSFEIRTNLDPKSAEGSSEWALFFHTHPKKTAERLGLPYFSPPSVEDVMEIYDRTLRAYNKSSVYDKIAFDKLHKHKNQGRKRLGETSVIFTSEGIWVLQVDHKAFLNMVRRTFGGKMPDDEILELILNETYNGFLVETLREINPDNNDLLNGMRAPDRILELLSRLVSDQYGFNLRFISWSTLEQRKELSFTTQLEHLEIVEQ